MRVIEKGVKFLPWGKRIDPWERRKFATKKVPE